MNSKKKDDDEDDWGSDNESPSKLKPPPKLKAPRGNTKHKKNLTHSKTAPSLASLRGPPKKRPSLSPALSRVGFKSTKEMQQKFKSPESPNSDNDDLDDIDLDLIPNNDDSTVSTAGPGNKFQLKAIPSSHGAGLDSDSDEDGGIVFGNVGHKKKRGVLKAKVVSAPSMKPPGNKPPGNILPSKPPPPSLNNVGRPLAPLAAETARIPVRNYQSMWQEQNGQVNQNQQFAISPINAASVVVQRSQEIRKALDLLCEQDEKTTSGTDSDDGNADDRDPDDDDNAVKHAKPQKHPALANPSKLPQKEKDRLREAMVMLIRSAERAGIDLKDPKDTSEEHLPDIAESICSEDTDEWELLPPPSSPSVAKYEKLLRTKLLQTWVNQFKYGDVSMDNVGGEGGEGEGGGEDSGESRIKSPYEIFEEMTTQDKLKHLLESKHNGEQKKLTTREQKELSSIKNHATTDTDIPLKEIICEMPSYVPWEAELELRAGDGKVVFVGVQKNGPADSCGIKDGDLLVQVGFDKITPRNLAQACQIIWSVKRNAQALSKKVCTIIITPSIDENKKFAVNPNRKKGDRRRHGLGDQGEQNGVGSVGSVGKNTFMNRNSLRVGLNRIHLPTNVPWGIKLSRGMARTVVVGSITKDGAGRDAGIQKQDEMLALSLPSRLSTTYATRHILLSKLGKMSRVRKEVQYAKEVADKDELSNKIIEVVVYRPPPSTATCWLGLSIGFDMTVENGNTIVSRVYSSGSAFDNGVKAGDIVVSMDGVRVSQPTTSLKRANMIVHECREVAINEGRRVIKFEFCQGD